MGLTVLIVRPPVVATRSVHQAIVLTAWKFFTGFLLVSLFWCIFRFDFGTLIDRIVISQVLVDFLVSDVSQVFKILKGRKNEPSSKLRNIPVLAVDR